MCFKFFKDSFKLGRCPVDVTFPPCKQKRKITISVRTYNEASAVIRLSGSLLQIEAFCV